MPVQAAKLLCSTGVSHPCSLPARQPASLTVRLQRPVALYLKGSICGGAWEH